MDESHIPDLKLLQRLPGERLHLLKRHFFVCLVVEVDRSAPARLVAYYAFKDDSSAVVAALKAGKSVRRVDCFADNQRAAPARRLSREPALSLPKGRHARVSKSYAESNRANDFFPSLEESPLLCSNLRVPILARNPNRRDAC